MSAHIGILGKAAAHANDGESVALCILVQTEGSVPQKAGAKMLVYPDGSIEGTIGGGHLEAEVIEEALQAIEGRFCRTVNLELTEAHGHTCGGRVLVYIEPIVAKPRLVIFGAGHVGRALCRLGRLAGFQVIIGDDRPEYANRDNLPDADGVVRVTWEDALSDISVDNNTYVVIATRGHSHDFQVASQVLETSARYIGLVGSKKKRSALADFLTGKNFTEKEIRRIVIPVGLPIGSVTPEEIAISIVAQLIENRRTDGPFSVGHSTCSGSLS